MSCSLKKYVANLLYRTKELENKLSGLSSLDYIVLDPQETLPIPSEETVGNIYLLLPDPNVENRDEYITIKKDDGTYEWEKLGSTDIDLTGYLNEDNFISSFDSTLQDTTHRMVSDTEKDNWNSLYKSISVGDVLFSDGTINDADSGLILNKTPIAICVADAKNFTNNKARFMGIGWIEPRGSFTKSVWGPVGVDTPLTNYENANLAILDVDGYEYTQTIKEFESGNISQDFNSFYICSEYSPGIYNKNWYLPTMGELQYVYKNKSLLVDELQKLNVNTTNLYNKTYWTSSESTGDLAWLYDLNTGSWRRRDKDYLNYVVQFISVPNSAKGLVADELSNLNIHLNNLENNSVHLSELNLTAAQKRTARSNIEAASVSLLSNLTEILDTIAHDYSKDYLTFTALEDTTFTFSTNALQYSLDNGQTWTTLNANTASPTITADSKILWKQTRLTPTSSNGIGTFSSTGNFNVSGNIMSLYYGDDFIGQKDLTGKNFAYGLLFFGNNNLVNAENLILPTTTLISYCYSGMFRDCTSLTTAPQLPATTLANNCYRSMFQGCSGLTEAPQLPATTLADYCYFYMFNGCTSLSTAPQLQATTLNDSCYAGMFQGCTSLTEAPQLPATTLVQGCYSYMFSGCTSLTTAPQLQATTLVSSCYRNMFSSCRLLNSITCLATDISASGCTTEWVNGVAASGTFITANIPPAWTTGNNGIPQGWTIYTESEWKEVKKYELATVATSGSYNDLSNKPTNVSSFTNDANYATTTTVTNSITSVKSEVDKKLTDYSKEYFTIVAKESGTITFTYDAGDESSTFTSMSYSKNNGEWVTTNYDSTNGNIITINVSNGDKVRWKGINNAMYYGDMENINFFSSFTSSCFVDIEGNIMSLLFDDNFIDKINLTGKLLAFASIFMNQYNQSILKIISAKNLILPATSLSLGCYLYMFYGCTSLTTAPEILPATTLAQACYSGMFNGCTSLTTAPELPATTLTNVCYDSMFRGCTSLTVAPTLPATTLADQCYNSMFYGCTSLTTAPELPATTLVQGCYINMFFNCTSLTTAPQLPATILANQCYYMMFNGCTSLNSITCLATDISASNCTTDWVYHVAASGTFVKPSSTDWSSKIRSDGIPSGWTVYTESEYELVRHYELPTLATDSDVRDIVTEYNN